VPFIFPYQDIPAVWVAGKQGKQILDSARRRDGATSHWMPFCRETPYHTVWAVMKGEVPGETIYAYGRPAATTLRRTGNRGTRPRSKVRYRTPICARDWKPSNDRVAQRAPEWWSGRIRKISGRVAGLAIEHLGALKTQRQSDSGRVEPAVQLTYATNSKMEEILENSWTEEMGTRLRSILTFHCAQSDACFSFISVRESRESRESRASQGG
jgi:hypothetical protein